MATRKKKPGGKKTKPAGATKDPLKRARKRKTSVAGAKNGAKTDAAGAKSSPKTAATPREPARAIVTRGDNRAGKSAARSMMEIDTPRELPKRAFTLSGPQDSAARDDGVLRFDEERSKLRVQTKATFRPASRDAKPASVRVEPDDVIEIEFDDGIRAWLSADEFLERCAPRANRSGKDPSDIVQVPDSLDVLPAPMRSRGPVAWTIKGLRVLGVDLAGMAIEQIAKLASDRPSLRRTGLGLHRCHLTTGEMQIVSPSEEAGPASDKPILVFLHGTFSSTWASFGDLWSAERADQLEELREAYEHRAYGFEHETLLESPVDNAIALATRLPKKARIHLVSQSRGGLVGELLCRSGRRSAAGAIEPFAREEIEALGDDPLAAKVRKLDQVLRDRQFVVERFVRVACPAMGTTLASGRLDRMLSVFGTAAGLLRAGPFAEAFADFGDFLAAIVKKRTLAREVPGIEAMMPESAFIRLLNESQPKVSGDLVVIAGDLDPQSLLAKALVWALDRFYESDHDLVVNTPSMRGGAWRDVALESAYAGAGVNHFAYFRNRDSAEAIVDALLGRTSDATRFAPLRPTLEPVAREVSRGPAGPRPVVFVLPGIMGSELHVEDDRVWMNVGRIIFGGFERLRLGNDNIKAKAILRSHYGELVDYLSETHKVITFPFDWRLSINDSAADLAVAIARELRTLPPEMPLRILAHSMGGLVARTMLSNNVDLRNQLYGRKGFRLVMCGTPNGGSHTITQLLVGKLGVLRMLSLADFDHDQEHLLGIISRFPGVLAMLPRDGREDYFAPATWKEYARRVGKGWVAPKDADLANARRFRESLDTMELDREKMIYVAGCADATVSRMFIDQESEGRARIGFMATTQGDGTVTWSTGIPPNVPTWYMRAKHGDLLRHEDSFRGLLELLETGRTAILSRTAPVARGVPEEFPLPREADLIYPDDDTLAAMAMQSTSRPRRRTRDREHPVRVRVLHGDLEFAHNAVAVGHYAGDTIVSAEKALDRKLDGELTRRNQLGAYPRDLESWLAFVERGSDGARAGGFEGAIIVGLGTAGLLTTSGLMRTMTRGLIEYALECAIIHRREHAKKREIPPCEIGVSPLLIGTNAGGINVADSVYAILQAVVAANAALRSSESARERGDAGRRTPDFETRISSVEFIELWEDRAILAMRALQSLTSDDRTADHELARAFDPELEIRVRKGARRRAVFEEPPGWWHRVQIRGESDDGLPQGMLRFTSTTRRARNEVRLLPTQTSLVDRFVREAIRTTRDDRMIARTLFERLLPNELKEEAPNTDNIVLHLDDASAAYPWELLEDPYGERKEPFVIQHGVLRQLEVRDAPPVKDTTLPNTALVIGDPDGPFVELTGAQEEAKAVARSLEASGYTVAAHYDRPSAKTVLNALHAQPYRILHLAGHGVYQYQRDRDETCDECGQDLPKGKPPAKRKNEEPVTGMVLSDDSFLTPAEVRQMRRTPELVFINCCHLGRIEANAETRDTNRRDDYNQIAANVASQFIRMGVRAVIAGGWAVDDHAALLFATTFYNHMLSGARLGEAVKAARRAVFDDNPSVNTWGAYQCYGDPDYVLPAKQGSVSGGRSRESYSSAAELVAEIDNIRAQLSLRAERDREWNEGQLRRMAAWLEKGRKERRSDGDWLRRGTIAITLARAFGEAELFDDAVNWYRDALDTSPWDVSLEDVESFAYLTCRAAVTESRSKGADIAALTKKIDDAVECLKWLSTAPIGMGGSPESAARGTTHRAHLAALFGSAAKRKAWIARTSSQRDAALQEMLSYYADAAEHATGTDKARSRLNVVATKIVLAWLRESDLDGGIGEKIAELRHDLQGLQESEEREFWIDVSLTNCDFLEALIGSTLDEELAQTLGEAYDKARPFASQRQFASVTDLMEFLRDMAKVADNQALAKSIDELVKKVVGRD